MNKAQKLLKALTNSDNDITEAFLEFDQEVLKLKQDLKQSIEIETLEEVKGKLEDFKELIQTKQITLAVEELRDALISEVDNLQAQFKEKTHNLSNLVSQSDQSVNTFRSEVEEVRGLVRNTTEGVSKLREEFIKAVSVTKELVDDKLVPDLGTHTIAVTLSAALDSVGGAVSFSGVHQTVPTEAFNSASATNVGAADATVDITTVADNDWVIDVVASDDTAITVGTGQTSRWNVTGALGSGGGSTEGPKTPVGAVTMSWAGVGALATWAIGAVAIRPLAASTLGGIFIKTINGLAQASVKTVNGLASASVKTVNGLATTSRNPKHFILL